MIYVIHKKEQDGGKYHCDIHMEEQEKIKEHEKMEEQEAMEEIKKMIR